MSEPADTTDGRRTGASRGAVAGMSRRQAWVTAAMAVLILIPSLYGFAGKFVEFVHIYRGTSGGEFAVAPILNYLLASAGFFCMLLWAAWNGMFRDVEKPKVDFLENEARLDGGVRCPLFRR
ncbi:MAG: hypothetical protein WCJ31_08605 [Planctomycetia bacterium]